MWLFDNSEQVICERVCILTDIQHTGTYVDKACIAHYIFGGHDWSWESWWFQDWVPEALQKQLRKNSKKREKLK